MDNLIIKDRFQNISDTKKKQLFESFNFYNLKKDKYDTNSDYESDESDEDIYNDEMIEDKFNKHTKDENILLRRRDNAIKNNDRYQKNFITSITIDSRDRDFNKYPKPNKYKVFLNKQFENVEKIELISTEIPNTIEPINIYNNKIKWKNISRSDYIEIYFPISNSTVTDEFNTNNFVTNTLTYETEIPTGYYNTTDFTLKMEEIMNETPDENNNPHNFHVDIDVNTHLVTLVQRFEELIISNMSMIKNSSLLNIEFDNINNINSSSWLNSDVILSDCPKIGGIPSKYLNLKNYEVTNVTTSSIIVDVLTDANINQIIRNLDITNTRVGRSVNFTLPQLSFTDTDNKNQDGTVNSILKILGFPVPTGQFVVIGTETPCRSIHLNEEYVLEEYVKAISDVSDLLSLTDSLHTLNIQNIGNNEYVFRSESYIFLRLTIPSNDTVNLGDNLLTTISNSGTIEKSNIYYDNPFQSLIENEKELLVKDVNNIFAKIQLSPIPGNITFNDQIYSEKIYYDIPLRKLSDIIIELIDSKGKIIDLKSDYSFTIKITEKIDVLKDTLMDSRTGDTVTSGINLKSLNKFY